MKGQTGDSPPLPQLPPPPPFWERSAKCSLPPKSLKPCPPHIIDNDNGQRSITAAISPLRYKTPFDGDARGSCLKRLGYVKRKRHLVTHAIGTRQRDKFL